MIFIALILSLSFSLDFSDFLEGKNTILNTNELDVRVDNMKTPIIYGLKSFVAPGLGQFSLYKENKNKKSLRRAALFFGVEVFGLLGVLNFNNKYNSQVNSYKNYANSEIGWDFSRWISEYETFNTSEFSYLFQNNVWQNIGAGSHSIQFYMGENIVSTTDSDFQNIYNLLLNTINSDKDVYIEHSIEVIKDQHFYENIGKYNEFFAGWSDADLENTYMETTEQNYMTARSPKKDQYIESYNKAEWYSDIKEYSTLCLYFNHFVSMVDAFILARKFNGNVMLTSATVYDKYRADFPVGIQLMLAFRL